MYRYEDLREKLFSDEGQRTFLVVRDEVHRLLEVAGAFSSAKAIKAGAGNPPWLLLACIDRLVELGEIVEVTGEEVRGQHRVFQGSGDHRSRGY